MKRPEGMAIPYVMMPRKYMAPKKMKRVEIRNSFLVLVLKRFLMASSFVFMKRDARSLKYPDLHWNPL